MNKHGFKYIERKFLKLEASILQASGAEFLSLNDIDDLSAKLYEKISRDVTPDIVVGISNGGDYPAYQIAQMAGTPLLHIDISRPRKYWKNLEENSVLLVPRITRRYSDGKAQLNLPFKHNLNDANIFLIDDDYVSQSSLNIAEETLRNNNAGEIVKGVLLASDEDIICAKKQIRLNKIVSQRYHLPWMQYSPHYFEYLDWKKKHLKK